ncbi:2TM domain-containing protein [uncultured Alistipes sp.]|uniref:2TM domain-containing protein n=1 Tax=uncultured Alistipes sp. TaxID=538949 RepID=UPI0025CB83C2|nr:2TM domain-containing protein [uncultured Alistipes sp.]
MEIIQSSSEKRRNIDRSLVRRLITYVVVCTFLVFVNWQTSPNYWWVLWVMAGWGLGIVLPLVMYLVGCDDERDQR